MGGRERFRQVVPGARPEGLNAAGDAWISRHDHDDGVLIRLQRRLEDLEPRHLGHIQIDQDDVELSPADSFQSLLTPADQRHIVPIHLKDAGTALPQGALIVYDEYPDAGLYFTGNG